MLTIGVLLFLLYRVVVKPKVLEAPKNEPRDGDEAEFVDYEEED